MKATVNAAVVLLGLAFGIAWVQAAQQRLADSIPTQDTDAEFWRLVTDFSEPDGDFPYENFVSNEINYQVVLPEVTRRVAPGGVYLGVAPEQNFTYVAAIKPKVAFIFDIRRQNLVELLMYKALFEISPIAGSSSRDSLRRPAGVIGPSPSPAELLTEINAARPDAALHTQTLQAIRDRLTRVHQFRLTAGDLEKIGYILSVFYKGGPRMHYAYASRSPNASVPSFYNLMVATDGRGKNWSCWRRGKLSIRPHHAGKEPDRSHRWRLRRAESHQGCRAISQTTPGRSKGVLYLKCRRLSLRELAGISRQSGIVATGNYRTLDSLCSPANTVETHYGSSRTLAGPERRRAELQRLKQQHTPQAESLSGKPPNRPCS